MENHMSNESGLRVTLAPHGTFACTLDQARVGEALTKPQLARKIAAGYEGEEDTPADTATYWLKLPKSVLVVVFGDMYRPATTPVHITRDSITGQPCTLEYARKSRACRDCGESGETIGHMGCQYPQDHR